MKAVLNFKFIRFFCVMAMLPLAGCVTSALGSSVPPVIVMRGPDHILVDGKAMDSSGLVKVLKRNRVPNREPLVIEARSGMPFEAIRLLTQRLASAGYKPVFKGERHADASVVPPPAPARGQKP